MRAASRVALALLACRACAEQEQVDFRVDMEGEVTFQSTGVSDVSSAMLTETMGIVCYNEWQNPEEGLCNAVDFSNGAVPEAGPHLALTDVKTQRFTVARFSDSMGVVCYTPFGTSHGRPACHTLSLSGAGPAATLSAGDGFEFDVNSTYPYALSVVGLTDTTGVLCYQDTTDDHGFGRHLTCMVLKVENATSLSSVAANVEGAEKAKPNPAQFDNITSTSMAKVSETEVVVCYVDGTKNVAFCNRMSLTESGDELSVGPAFVLREALPGASPGSLSVVALSESKGVACYCDGPGGRGPTCAPLDFNGTTEEVSGAGDHLTVGEDVACSEVSVAAVSETGAIACYLAGSGQVGTCSGLRLNHGSVLTTGDPTEIPAASGASDNGFVAPSECSKNQCDQWISVSAEHDTNAVVCYAGVGGSATGRCTGLTIPPPTSTSTVTTTETSSTTGTTSTTEHTTTGTSTSTETHTETTVSTTTETSSTTPHTTTATETSTSATTVTDVPELSGAPAQAAGCVAAIAVASVLLF